MHVAAYGTVKLDANGCIKFDLECARRGYNLRGQKPDHVCPECGFTMASVVHFVRTRLASSLVCSIVCVAVVILSFVISGVVV